MNLVIAQNGDTYETILSVLAPFHTFLQKRMHVFGPGKGVLTYLRKYTRFLFQITVSEAGGPPSHAANVAPRSSPQSDANLRGSQPQPVEAG